MLPTIHEIRETTGRLIWLSDFTVRRFQLRTTPGALRASSRPRIPRLAGKSPDGVFFRQQVML